MRGKSLLDLLWEQLDQFVEDYQALSAKATNWDTRNQSAELASAKGAAHAAAVCVALVTNPYHPDVAAIKAEALERWGLAGDEPTPPVRTQNERTDQRPTREERRAARLARRSARNG